MTNSGGTVIGGSCGGLVLFCVAIYLLYRLLKPEPPRIDQEPTVHVIHPPRAVPDRRSVLGSAPTVIHVLPAEAATNQNRIVCSRCRDAPSSPPPSYEDCFSVQGSVAVGCDDCIACMSAVHEKYPTN